MLRLSYVGQTSLPLEAACIAPDRLAGKSLAEIATLPVLHGNTRAALGDFFQLQGDASDAEVVVEGDCSRLKWLGADMAGGVLTIRGSAGMHTGSGMRGGELIVHGEVSDWAGAEMSGGRLHIHGNAGHLAGAGYRGSRHGMRGGVLLIDGTAGDELGATLRRGLIVARRAGRHAACNLIAGTVMLLDGCGVYPGAGMKRGTLVLAGAAPSLLPTFLPSCIYEPVFLRLYWRQLRAWGYSFDAGLLNARWHRHCGDRVALGKGEILTRVA